MWGTRHSDRGQSGQASVEWLGVALVTALALGALGAVFAARGGAAPARDRGLGALVAERLACSARDACLRAPAAPPPPVRFAAAGIPRARAIDALRRLRAVGAKLVNRAWIACIGYTRLRRELEQPRPPNEFMPLDEAFGIAHRCLNPYAFLVDG